MKVKPSEQKQIIAEAVALAVRDAASATAKAVSDAATAAASASNTVITLDIAYIKADLKEIKETLKVQAATYVNQDMWALHVKRDEEHEARIGKLEMRTEDFPLVKKVVWGAVSFILISVLGAIVFLVINK